jgi:dephospho-CoA kinase
MSLGYKLGAVKSSYGQRIGLTGGIGSGKSTVARMLVSQGAVVIDADAISRKLTAPHGAAIAAIAEQFGAGAITTQGAMDRDAMRALVFSNPAARHQLEAIIHPLVSQEAASQAEAALRAGCPCTVFDIPLLVESGRWRQQLDLILVVDCAEATQISRVMTREASRQLATDAGWTAEAVQKVINGQASRLQRLAAADLCVHNEGLSLEELGQVVAELSPRLGL